MRKASIESNFGPLRCGNFIGPLRYTHNVMSFADPSTLRVLRYGKNWFHSAKRLLKEYTEEEAKAAHEARELYAVLLGQGEQAQVVVVANQDFWDVSFLDDSQREMLHYQFHENRPGELFLKSSTENTGQPQPTIRFYSPDGVTQVQQGASRGGQLEEADVSGNWCRRPQFGQYEELLKRRT